MSVDIHVKSSRVARSAVRALGVAGLVFATVLMASCDLLDRVSGETFAEAPPESRRKTCDIERSTAQVALLRYQAAHGSPATSLDQLVEDGWLISVIGHELSEQGELVEVGGCAAGEDGLTPDGAPADLVKLASILDAAHLVYQTLMSGDSTDQSYRMSDPEVQCVAGNLNQAIGEDGMRAIAANPLTAGADQLEAARNAFNFCASADALAGEMVDAFYQELGGLGGGAQAPSATVRQCASGKLQGRVGDVMVFAQTGDDPSVANSLVVDVIAPCVPASLAASMLKSGFEEGGMPPAVAGCAAERFLAAVGFDKFLEASFADKGTGSAMQAFEPAITEALQACS